MAVDGLTATVGDLGLTGDVAMEAGQSGGGVGDPGGEGYLGHGVGLLECGSCKQSHSGGPPPRTIKIPLPVAPYCQLEKSRFDPSWDGVPTVTFFRGIRGGRSWICIREGWNPTPGA